MRSLSLILPSDRYAAPRYQALLGTLCERTFLTAVRPRLLGSGCELATPEAPQHVARAPRSASTNRRRAARAAAPGRRTYRRERDRPYTDDPGAPGREERFAAQAPDQLPLFAPGPAGAFTPGAGWSARLVRHSSLELARAWYRRELEQAGRPANTVESYCYDLVVLEKLIGPKPIDAINQTDIARLLGDANGRATRKRRLTSARRFFRYLIDDARVAARRSHRRALSAHDPAPLAGPALPGRTGGVAGGGGGRRGLEPAGDLVDDAPRG